MKLFYTTKRVVSTLAREVKVNIRYVVVCVPAAPFQPISNLLYMCPDHDRAFAHEAAGNPATLDHRR
jgi:hypothetical protein